MLAGCFRAVTYRHQAPVKSKELTDTVKGVVLIDTGQHIQRIAVYPRYATQIPRSYADGRNDFSMICTQGATKSSKEGRKAAID